MHIWIQACSYLSAGEPESETCCGPGGAAYFLAAKIWRRSSTPKTPGQEPVATPRLEAGEGAGCCRGLNNYGYMGAIVLKNMGMVSDTLK